MTLNPAVTTYRPYNGLNPISCNHSFLYNGFRYSGHSTSSAALTLHTNATSTEKVLDRGVEAGGSSTMPGTPDYAQPGWAPAQTTPPKDTGADIPSGSGGPNVLADIPSVAPAATPDFSPTGDLDNDGIANSKDKFFGPGASAPAPDPVKTTKPVVTSAPAPTKTEQEVAFYAALTKAMDAAKAGNPQPLKDFDRFFGIPRPAEEYTAEFYAPRPTPEPTVTEVPTPIIEPAIVEPTTTTSTDAPAPQDSPDTSTSTNSSDSSTASDSSSSSSSSSTEVEVENESSSQSTSQAEQEQEQESEAALATATANKKSAKEDRIKKLNEMRKGWGAGASSSKGADAMVVPPITPASQVPPAPL